MSRRSGANGAPVPVAVKPRSQQFASGGLGFGGTGRFNGFGGYQLHVSEYFGSGHTGVTPTDRIVMAFKCGIDSEIEQSLMVVRLPEPLRATTWLRCCYEPYYPPSEAASNINETSEVAPGEVTQISLWKAYETQFEEIWKNDSKLDHASLLAAVEFIKNVTSAFPESETMVVNIPSADPSKPAKKKFVIKGIQPRQFPVSIEIGNYEALRKRQNQAMILGNESSGDSSLPVGHVDYDKFQHIISLVNDKILEPNPDLPKIENHFLNSLSHDILDYIITELLDPDTDGEYKNIFRYYNIDWLPELIYANPGLIQNGYINTKWLLYLV
ncbi:hypothetical protein QCA50_017690 [Cerrena zonata]|uniref:RFX-type winged-helix domain-containing protein n=1 Tax=Cerrena zonata TaxID=2478898 RepID=A0AAW0FEK8_9APHY